jgi:low affinity Fe/Cu permease
MPEPKLHPVSRFTRLGRSLLTSHTATVLACAAVLSWLVYGAFVGFGIVWATVGGTAASAVTLLMVFLLEHDQHRESRALHLKLDELLMTHQNAEDGLAGIERRSEEDLAEAEEQVLGSRS